MAAKTKSSHGGILISTGEASGDALGAAFIREIRVQGHREPIRASGSQKIRAEGARMIADSTHWGAIGIYQALRLAPRIVGAYRKIRAEIRRSPPSLFVAIDFGYLNVRLCRLAKSEGSKVLYFMPPGSWRRDKQGSDLPAVTDAIATPFAWSARILNEMGATAEWVGHPILQLAGDTSDRERTTIAVLPGSRHHEVANNLVAIADALTSLSTRMPSLPAVELIAAPSVLPNVLQTEFSRLSNVKFTVTVEPAVQALKRAKVAIVCSGTATLECAICDVPMVVVYRGDALMAFEFRLRRPRFDYIALPSIILDRSVVPELLQNDASPQAIADHAEDLMADSTARRSQLEAFSEIRAALGPSDAITRTAAIALRLLAG